MLQCVPGLSRQRQKGLTYEVVQNNASFNGFNQYVVRSATDYARLYDGKVNFGAVHPWDIAQSYAATSP